MLALFCPSLSSPGRRCGWRADFVQMSKVYSSCGYDDPFTLCRKIMASYNDMQARYYKPRNDPVVRPVAGLVSLFPR